MKYKILMSICIFVLLFNLEISGQNSYNYQANLLENRDWYLSFPAGEYCKIKCQGMRYTKGEQVSFMYIDGVKNEVGLPYYLSETPDSEFKWEKVGKSIKGRYIIFLMKNGKIKCSQIVNLTSSVLVMRSLWNNKQFTFTTKRPD